jgi:hypothetical protein
MGENPAQCHFIDQKFCQWTITGVNRGLHSEKQAINYLRYVMATVNVAADGGQCMEKKTSFAFIHTHERKRFIIHLEL